MVHPDTEQMSTLFTTWTDVNHMYVVENFLRQLVSAKASRQCELSATFTTTGNISIVLESIQGGDYTVCKNSARELAREINGHYPAVEDSMLRPIAKTAFLLDAINPVNIVNSFVEETTDKITDTATNTVNDGLMEAENGAVELEREHNRYIDSGFVTRASVGLVSILALILVCSV